MRTGCIWMPEGGFAHAVAHEASPDQTTIMEAVQRPIAMKCIQEKAPVPAWKTKPSWFLLAEEDRMIAPETQRYMAERMGAKIRAHHVDHSPMYAAPDVVVSVILEAARETLACLSPLPSSLARVRALVARPRYAWRATFEPLSWQPGKRTNSTRPRPRWKPRAPNR